MTETGYLDVNGGRLYYEVEGEGHPLVLIHAGIAKLRMWDEQVRAWSLFNEPSRRLPSARRG